MQKDNLSRIIRDFHLAAPPKLFERDIDVPFSTGKIVSLIGARRTGKTSLLFNLMEKLKKHGLEKEKILYLNFEDERLELRPDELDLILRAYQELYNNLQLKDCYFFFDEIQNIRQWDKFVRRLYDSVTKNIFITDSNSKFLSSDIATSLRGRTISYEVFPLSFNEYLRFKEAPVDLYSSESLAKINTHLTGYFNNGGFPEVVNYGDNLREKVLQEYFNVMIYRDLVERYEIKNASVLKYFIKRLLACSTKQFSVNTIFNELKSAGFKVGKNQLYEYLDYCQSIYLIFILNKYDHKLISRELGERKIYSIDNGLLNAVSFKFSEDKGKALEQVVFQELRRRGSDIYFYKDTYECDFVVKTGDSISETIQVSSALADSLTKKREVRGILSACRKFGLKSGVIITSNTQEDLLVEGVKIKVVPLYLWLLNPDRDAFRAN